MSIFFQKHQRTIMELHFLEQWIPDWHGPLRDFLIAKMPGFTPKEEADVMGHRFHITWKKKKISIFCLP